MGCKIGPKGIANVLETMMLEKINLKKKNFDFKHKLKNTSYHSSLCEN
jgi:hypothetical protein